MNHSSNLPVANKATVRRFGMCPVLQCPRFRNASPPRSTYVSLYRCWFWSANRQTSDIFAIDTRRIKCLFRLSNKTYFTGCIWDNVMTILINYISFQIRQTQKYLDNKYKRMKSVYRLIHITIAYGRVRFYLQELPIMRKIQYVCSEDLN